MSVGLTTQGSKLFLLATLSVGLIAYQSADKEFAPAPEGQLFCTTGAVPTKTVSYSAL